MNILTLEQLLQLHALVIESTGGSSGLRDLGRLEAAIATQTQNIFGEELYVNIEDKAAAMVRGVIGDHAFVDGNKRTGMLACLTLMKINGLNYSFANREIEDFAVKIATEKLDVPVISQWLKKHTI
jgi:death-on-curing protein